MIQTPEVLPEGRGLAEDGEVRRRRLLKPDEAKKLKKGLSKTAKVLLAAGLGLAGAAVVGGAVAKSKWNTMNHDQRLNAATAAVDRTSWFPWLSNRIRHGRDKEILRQLELPNSLPPAERLRLAAMHTAATPISR